MMSGKFLQTRHRCDLPFVQGTGDLWQCECGRVWRSTHSDRWVQLTWIERLLRGIE